MSIETREYDINFFKESIIGRKTDEVLMEIEKRGYESRLASIDGEEFMLTMDLNLKRINLHIEKGIVIGSFIG